MRWPNGYGIWLPCLFVKIRDGDTVEVVLPGSDRRWPIRLLDCYAPEKSTEKGEAAANRLRDRVEGQDGSVFIPAPANPLKITQIFSFDRILAHAFDKHGNSLADLMIQDGLASRIKE